MLPIWVYALNCQPLDACCALENNLQVIFEEEVSQLEVQFVVGEDFPLLDVNHDDAVVLHLHEVEIVRVEADRNQNELFRLVDDGFERADAPRELLLGQTDFEFS